MAGWKFCQFLLLLTLWASTTVAQRSSYGEECDDTIKCDKRAWLTCRNGTCDCMKPDVMMYEDSIGKCASKSGERCKFVFEELGGNNIYEIMDCVVNSNCSSDGFCACDSKFYEDLDGTCIPAQSHMESCNSMVKCSNYEALQCSDGLCKCNESVSTFYSNGESSARQCVGLAEESCINSKCVQNASCSNETLCVCDDGFYQDDDKQCVPKISVLGNCTKTDRCMNFKGTQLICLDGVCSCDPSVSRYGSAQKSGFESEQYYYNGYRTRQVARFTGPELTQCLGLSDSPCLDSLCVANGYCNSGTCTCTDGYTKSKYGNCAHGYDASCVLAEDCIDGLMCKQKKCRCPFNDQDFDSSTKKCVSKVDGPCNSSTSCVDNAQCSIFSRTPIEAGHCSCKKGYIKNSEGECSAQFAQPCVESTDCDKVAALVCTNQICQCDNFAKYSEKHRKCLGFVGASCDLNLNKVEPQCVENSKCERVHPRLQGVCACPTGFKETSLYTCELGNEVVKIEQDQDDEQEAPTSTSTSTELPPPPPPQMDYRDERKTLTSNELPALGRSWHDSSNEEE